MVECINRLLASPPTDQQGAQVLFGYFATRISELGENYLIKLRHAPIVPIFKSKKQSSQSEKSVKSLSYMSPSRVYLGTSETYAEIFDFVDFGNDANAFLFRCGAKNEPTKSEVAHMACAEPARLLEVLQTPERYLDLLKSLAEAAPILQRDRELWKKMKATPMLLGYKEIASTSSGKLIDIEDEEAPIRHYQLASASEIVVLDDIISYRLFKDHLLCAPEEDALELFYISLGAQKLSAIVQEDIRIGPHTSGEKMAQSLRKLVLERSKIFLHEYTNYRRDAIKHDAKWLEKNLHVEMVRSVALRRTLNGHHKSHTEKRSAAGTNNRGQWTLYIADEGRPDMYQVGQAVCQMLLNRPNQQAYLFFEPFLTLDLLGLRARGYNVDRILRAKAAEARIAEQERQKALQEEQKQIQEREQQWTAGQQHIPEHRAAEAAREVASTPEKTRPSMPGAWSSPEDSGLDRAAQNKKGKGLFSSLTKRLGLENHGDENNESKKQLEQFLDKPQQQSDQAGGGSVGPPPGSQNSLNDDGRVTSPAVVQQNLFNAIKSTRPHGSDSVFSEPKVNQIKEQPTYCDKTPAHNITSVAEASNGMKVYIARELAGSQAATFLANNSVHINSFALLLVDIANIYSLAPKVLHIYYDQAGGTIAFNTGGSIFCNLRFFLQLHATQLQSQNGLARAEAASWWWVVVAHELAHNLVSAHNSDHSYYT